jgi:serine/threonine-protein kinase
MATVYLGRLLGPVGFARTVAIKRLHPKYASEPKFVSMFLDEARLAARIRHPNVVPTLDVVTTEGELFLVMEYVHGESLAKLIQIAAKQEIAIPVPIVVAVMSGVLQGLHAAHEAKSERGAALQIIHRDVSPQNMLVGRDGTARLLDFGVARAQERLHKTQEGLVKGKIGYMAPEQLRGEELGPATDVYAAGVVMWEALTGRPLFSGKGPGGQVVEVLEGTIESPSAALRAAGQEARANEVAPLDALLLRALDRDKSARCQSARELSRAIEALVVPATAANVSDWVDAVAGEALRDRASIVAEIESKTALELTQADIGVAMADGTDVGADLGWQGGAVTVPDRSPGAPAVPLAAPSAPDTKEMSTAPSPTVDERDVAPSSPEPQPATVPLGPQPVERAREAPSPAPAAVAEPAARHSSPPKAKPLPGTATLLSASRSPLAPGAIPQLLQTMQSVAPPAGGAPQPEARAVTVDTLSTRKRSRGRVFLIVFAVVVVGALGGAYAASQSSPPALTPAGGTIEMQRVK